MGSQQPIHAVRPERRQNLERWSFCEAANLVGKIKTVVLLPQTQRPSSRDTTRVRPKAPSQMLNSHRPRSLRTSQRVGFRVLTGRVHFQ